jgi:hypothetical protein
MGCAKQSSENFEDFHVCNRKILAIAHENKDLVELILRGYGSLTVVTENLGAVCDSQLTLEVLNLSKGWEGFHL